MKQLLQDLKTGKIDIVDVPVPQLKDESLLVSSNFSLVSKGTEKMLIDFGKSNYLKKAQQQPDKVKQVLTKIKTDGIYKTYDAVKSKLDQPIPLGYCNVGRVIESSTQLFSVGDRVVSNGYHAENVCVSKNLCAKIPENVDDQSAAFTVLGSIGLQGIRLLKPEIGETIAVIGLGLIGLISVQILKANGCRVIGIDKDLSKCELAEKYGAHSICLQKDIDPVKNVLEISNGIGADGVLITASTKSNDVISQAANMSRVRGRIVLVGVVGLDISRDDFYKKELTFQVSSSYGPGRYDSNYEDKGIDYPEGFVRWTAKRNFEAILNLMNEGHINTELLISKVHDFDNAEHVYENLDDDQTLGILLKYNGSEILNHSKNNLINLSPSKDKKSNSSINIGFIGAGNYASRILIPCFKKNNINLHTIVSSGGFNSKFFGNKFGFSKASSESSDIFSNKEIDTVVIASRHDSHANYILKSLTSNKNIFVEKPLAINEDEIKNIENFLTNKDNESRLMIGFNRRFAKHSIIAKKLLQKTINPKSFIMTVNAGQIPKDNWVHDKKIGGGRIIGEACHFVDLMRFFVGEPIKSFQVMNIGNDGQMVVNDKVAITLSFQDGSFGTINYLANGGSSFPKERIEIFCDNSVLQIDNWIKMKGYNWPGFKKSNLWSQDKGQNLCVKKFVDSINSGDESPIPLDEILEVSKTIIKIDSLIN